MDAPDPQVDTSNTTVSAFNNINTKNQLETLSHDNYKISDTANIINKTTRVKVYTPFDDRTHTYFHSLSIDKEITDFMGTAELKCPYDSDLMGYWEPARAYCIIYGTNKGAYKILFIGRVREVNQIGYEISISLQDYGWKFKQLVTQSYANDNVIGKDGYTIMKLIFQALKIDSWVISPAAKYRLKTVGVDKDGNVTVNKKEVEHIPDLISRLKKSDPRKSINKYTIYNKVKESELHNINNINYTLRYEKPTKVMQDTAKQGDYEAGESVYSSNYGSGGSDGSSGGNSSSKNKASKTISASGNPRPPTSLCNNVKSTSICSALKVIWAYNRGYSNELTSPKNAIDKYAANYPAAYYSQVEPVLRTMSKLCKRKDGKNGAQIVLSSANIIAAKAKNPVNKKMVKTAVAIKQYNQKNKNKNSPFSAIGNFLLQKRN